MKNRFGTDAEPSEIYILHFERPYWKRARHYVGYTSVGAEKRIQIQRSGKGSLLVDYALNKKGIDFTVGLVENFACKAFGRQRERQFKKEGHLARHCEVCQRRKADGESIS